MPKNLFNFRKLTIKINKKIDKKIKKSKVINNKSIDYKLFVIIQWNLTFYYFVHLKAVIHSKVYLPNCFGSQEKKSKNNYQKNFAVKRLNHKL